MSAGSVAYPAGSLVRARGRDWVVLPGSDADVLVLRPLTGGDDEVAGVFLPLEGAGVTPASFALPDSARTGDVAGCLLLQDAADLVVLDVLIRKAKTIRQRLGVSVPVPVQSEQVVQAVVDSVLLRGRQRGVQFQLPLFDEQVSQLHLAWDEAAERERKQRAFFAQRGIEPDEVARELEACDPVLGDAAAVQRFLADALQRLGGDLRATSRPGVFELHPGELHHALETRGYPDFLPRVAFDSPADGPRHRAPSPSPMERGAREGGVRPVLLGRTQPIVSACCDAVLGAALSPDGDERFARSGAVFTANVARRTGVVLLRLRYLLRERADEFAEEIVLAAFQRQGDRTAWVEPLDSAARELPDILCSS